MHEDLLGYLLGALEPDEMQRVSEWLRDNPEGQRQLKQIEDSLRPLEDGFEAIEPPSDDLIARTMASIPSGPPPKHDEASTNRDEFVTLSDAQQFDRGWGRRSRWTMIDSVGGLLSVAILLALLLPTIASGRFEARKIACQDHLRELGTAVIQYVSRDYQRRLPKVAESGPEAFAGMYALRLDDAGLLGDPMTRWCPSADLPEVSQQESQLISVEVLPPVTALREVDVDNLKTIQRLAGGHYAYNLGVIDDFGYSAPRFESRGTFAIMADAPVGYQLHPGQAPTLRFSHGGQGLNVLYEDGAVRFIDIRSLDSMPDNPLINHRGESEAGVNIDDASLSPSWRPPFTNSIQR